MFCPHCGADNPDTAFNCASCGWPLRPATDSVAVLGREGQVGPEHGPGNVRLPGQARAWRSSTKKLTAATVLAAGALALLMASFLLYVYYYESLLSPDHGIDDIYRLRDVAKFMQYTQMFGILVAAIAFAVAVAGVMGTGWIPVAAFMRRFKLSSILWLAVLMAVLAGTSAFVVVYVNEVDYDFSAEAMRMISRLAIYPTLVVDVLGTAVLLIVTYGLRKATVETRPDRPVPMPPEGVRSEPDRAVEAGQGPQESSE